MALLILVANVGGSWRWERAGQSGRVERERQSDGTESVHGRHPEWL